MIDGRAVAAADLERILRAYQPDDDGHCALCKAVGDVVGYPCDAWLLCDRPRSRCNAGAAAPARRPDTEMLIDKPANRPGAVWKRRSKCISGGNCVEVADLPDAAAVRNSNDPDGPVLVYGRREWSAFVAGVKNGEFDHD
jgi:hypothetical protein